MSLGVVLVSAQSDTASWERAVSLYTQNQYRESIVEFKKVLTEFPAHSDSWKYAGLAHFQIKECPCSAPPPSAMFTSNMIPGARTRCTGTLISSTSSAERDLTLTAGYVGASGVHLAIASEDLNMVPPSLATRTPDGQYHFPLTGAIQRLNPNYSKISGITWNGHSSYHALQTNLVKRFSHGFTVQSTYTWSKDIDNGSNTLSSS